MKVTTTPLPGVKIVQVDRYGDDRGWFNELWNEERYAAAGIVDAFPQTNVSCSARGVLRGLHYQHPHGQAKLISVIRGRIFDVAVDIRRGSPTFGQWFGHELSGENHTQLYIPAGMAHGFLALDDDSLVHYSCSTVYHGPSDRAVAWNDPDIAIDWPEQPRTISEKDRSAPLLRDLDGDELPLWPGP